jgi:N-acetylneuraminate synthase/N,N'-diacetyllegionaminate synthase
VIHIGSRAIGPGEPVLVIAEAGVNHNGDVDLACRLVDAAADAGADAVKFQTFKADRVAGPAAAKAAYQLETTDPGETQLEMLRRLELGREQLEEVRARCVAGRILFLSTPFDEESVDLLDELGVPAFKIPSGDVTNWPLLRHVATKGKPVLLSTGMSYLGEVDDAVRVLRDAGCRELALLHCVTSYPTRAEDANLRAMRTMADAFGVPVGFSDHTEGLAVAVAAVALGACVLEKHLTLNRSLPGPDQAASLEPAEFHTLVAEVRAVEAALGDGRKQPAQREAANRPIVRRSVAAAVDLPAGTVLRREMLCALRPAAGLAPAVTDQLVGRTTIRPLVAGELVTWSDLQ